MDNMPSSEFSRWIEYEKLEPFGAVRDNIHAGIIASTLINLFGRRGNKASPSDFLLIDRKTHDDSKTRGFFSMLASKAKPKK